MSTLITQTPCFFSAVWTSSSLIFGRFLKSSLSLPRSLKDSGSIDGVPPQAKLLLDLAHLPVLLKLYVPRVMANVQQVKDEVSSTSNLQNHVLNAKHRTTEVGLLDEDQS